MSQGFDLRPQAVPQHSRRLFLRGSTAMAVAGGSAAVLLGSPAKLLAGEEQVSSHGQGGRFFSIRGDERSHVAFLKSALGSKARPMPTFQGLLQSSFDKFANVAQALENTGCGAYLGALPYIKNSDYVTAAGSIALIEGRHAGYLNTFLSDSITANALNDDSDNDFEVPLTDAKVGELAGPFIANLNGGPPIGYDTVQTDANDIDILNFALALEYLEREFYNLNYAKYFSKN